ncbi:hypothetical protein B0T10DRAFT_585787 [Thelonectria olida]|uniref:Uncharacterized protein n=1 Tax=Thelonectria olida TaxID=1576542 RepID=A0A9P9AJR9_9HYPO|nr:hypothetical protein B0T10DRAFT_585787 [Thelonectria olida]
MQIMHNPDGRIFHGVGQAFEWRPEEYCNDMVRIAIDDPNLPSRVVVRKAPAYFPVKNGFAHECEVWERVDKYKLPCAPRFLGLTMFGNSPGVVVSELFGESVYNKDEVSMDSNFLIPRITAMVQALRAAGIETELDPDLVHCVDGRFYLLGFPRARLLDPAAGELNWPLSVHEEVLRIVNEWQGMMEARPNEDVWIRVGGRRPGVYHGQMKGAIAYVNEAI